MIDFEIHEAARYAFLSKGSNATTVTHGYRIRFTVDAYVYGEWKCCNGESSFADSSVDVDRLDALFRHMVGT